MQRSRLLNSLFGTFNLQLRTVNLIRTDPKFNDYPPAMNELMSWRRGHIIAPVADAANPYTFTSAKRGANGSNDWGYLGGESGHPNDLEIKTLVVGKDGTITIKDGDKIVNDDIDKYLFHPCIRDMCEALAHIGYVRSSYYLADIYPNTVILERKMKEVGRTEKGNILDRYSICIARDGSMSYMTKADGQEELRKLSEIREKEIMDLHQELIAPFLKPYNGAIRFKQ